MRLYATLIIVFSWAAYFCCEAVPAKSRIIGGNPAHIGSYPFAAAINVQTTTSKFFCGGALYFNRWVITAGQCVNGATLFTIHLGSDKLESSEPTRLTLASAEYVLHPEYNAETLEHDVGLIRLRIAITFTDYIRPIAPLGMHELPAKENLRAIGWGQTSDSTSSLSNELHVSSVISLTNEECQITYGNQITETMVCIAGSFNEGACHGDTGSPLLDAYSKYGNIHVGIASFVSGNGCESTDPSGYTRTYSYAQWIYNVTA